MNILSLSKRVQIISSLVEGNSIRATCRMTGAAKGTVLSLLCDVGKACKDYQNKTLVKLPCKNIQCDEIWAFCYGKQKNLSRELQDKFGYGSVWTWVALDVDTKLVPCWYLGGRDLDSAYIFMKDLEWRLKEKKIQITTDGFPSYLEAVPGSFGHRVDYAQVQKIYGGLFIENEEGERRYSPREVIGMNKVKLLGNPEDKLISTSLVERQNLTMRMSMRRFTRLTNAFSKKVENLDHALALHYMNYNFCRPHMALNKKRNLNITPAMSAGVTDHQWKIEEIVSLLDH